MEGILVVVEADGTTEVATGKGIGMTTMRAGGEASLLGADTMIGVAAAGDTMITGAVIVVATEETIVGRGGATVEEVENEAAAAKGISWKKFAGENGNRALPRGRPTPLDL